ncbi:hypothetical protein [Rugamonas apoptosis]|uniref:Uncharacterized protein n=1 Tax=Rugamonas apoptosis TaxID=2758570 RepID=A0A7W2FCF4_9BURK|nr:hypothetical protein [Rugamonas apoptosis]MBA5689151.1 hypothetical protein [Rugamonas apoptosis]
MMIDYCKGQYTVRDMNGALFGRIDEDECVRSGSAPRFRIDGDEFYTLDGVLIGFIQSGIVTTPKGERRYIIASEYGKRSWHKK